MDRRTFVKAGIVGVGATALAAPAIAQSMPEIKWRLTSGFPKSLDTLFGGAELLVRQVAEATDNKFQITPFAAGEIVPQPAIVDAVQNKTVEIGHTASYYYVGKDPAFAIPATLPFGLNTRASNAWWYHGGGDAVCNEFFKKFNIYALAGGNTGAQMGGWFRKEINTIADLNGLKFRIAGLAGAILAKHGVIPQTLPGADIYPALEKGTIDAAEWVGPYDDEKLGFDKVAKYYYYPGWWEGSTMIHFMINAEEWGKLPKAYQAILRSAAANVNVDMMARYDSVNPKAIRSLVSKGVQLRPFSPAILEACYNSAKEVYADLSSKNAEFKKLYDAMIAFRAEEFLWFQLTDGSFDNFMMAQQRAGRL